MISHVKSGAVGTGATAAIAAALNTHMTWATKVCRSLHPRKLAEIVEASGDDSDKKRTKGVHWLGNPRID